MSLSLLIINDNSLINDFKRISSFKIAPTCVRMSRKSLGAYTGLKRVRSKSSVESSSHLKADYKILTVIPTRSNINVLNVQHHKNEFCHQDGFDLRGMLISLGDYLALLRTATRLRQGHSQFRRHRVQTLGYPSLPLSL